MADFYVQVQNALDCLLLIVVRSLDTQLVGFEGLPLPRRHWGRVVSLGAGRSYAGNSAVSLLEDLSQSSELKGCDASRSLILSGEMSEWLKEHAWK